MNVRFYFTLSEGGKPYPPAHKPIGPSGIYVNINGTSGHYITRDLEVNEGHSNTRSYGTDATTFPPISDGSDNVPYGYSGNRDQTKPTHPSTSEPIHPSNRWGTLQYKNKTLDKSETSIDAKPNYQNPSKPTYDQGNPPIFTTHSPSRDFDLFAEQSNSPEARTDRPGIELPTVSIGESRKENKNRPKTYGKQKETLDFGGIGEPDVDNYEIEVLDEESWKPRLNFENKTKETNVQSVIMKINKKNDNVEVLDVKLAPWQEGERNSESIIRKKEKKRCCDKKHSFFL